MLMMEIPLAMVSFLAQLQILFLATFSVFMAAFQFWYTESSNLQESHDQVELHDIS